MVEANRAFSLDSIENLRELGSYKNKEGKFTKDKVYLRGGDTSNLNDSDLKKLIDYGVTQVIDLRSTFEVDQAPSKFKELNEVEYINIPMLDGLASMKEKNTIPESMFEVYKNLLDNSKDDYRRIFQYFLKNKGVSLFHCSAGKDRTGVLAFLILGLAKVDRETILVDYEVSENNLKNFIKNQSIDYKRQTGENFPQHFLESKRIDMEKTLDYLKENYKSVKNYLMICGLKDHELEKLNEKFI